jgi:hypothetical protein
MQAKPKCLAFSASAADSVTSVDPGKVQALALAAQASPATVRQVYQEELRAIAADARITQFLDVIVERRVRMRLRKRLAHRLARDSACAATPA